MRRRTREDDRTEADPLTADRDPAVAVPDGEAAAEQAVKDDIDGVRGFVRHLSMDDLRDGTWFAQLLRFSLNQYTQEVDAEYFQRKYPTLPADAIVQARIAMAARYAGISGGLTASAYSSAISLTIGSGGAASPLTAPSAIASFAVDLCYTSQLQLRLAHDIAVLYRVPLDLSDPDDLWRLIRIAFGIKAGEVGSSATLKAVPAVVRPLVKKVFSGSTLAAAKSLPVVGKHLLQRNLVKFAIPVVSVPLSVGVNHWTTKHIGDQARGIFRTEARIIEAASRIASDVVDHDTLLWVLWLTIQANATVHDNQRLLLHHTSRAAGTMAPELGVLDDLRDVIAVDERAVWSKVDACEGDPYRIYDAAMVAAAVDGRIDRRERDVLEILAERCGTTYDESVLKGLARSWA